MAQIPNYYFNSPYIADAARNLASALAPQDPEKLLARQKMAFEFEQEKEKARLEEQARAEMDIGRDYAAQLASMEPIMMADGKTVDKEATFNQARKLYAGMIQNRIDPKMAEAIAGPFGPGFAAKSQLAEITGDARMDYLTASLAGQLGIHKYDQSQSNARTVGGWQNQLTLQQMRNYGAYQSALARAANTQTRKGAKVSVPDLEQITFLIMSKEMQDPEGRQLFDDERDKLIDAAVELFKSTGNHQGAVNAVWDATVGGNQRAAAAPGKWEQLAGYDPYSGYIKPDISKLSQFSQPGGAPTLGGAAIGAPGGAPGVFIPPSMDLPGTGPLPAPTPPAAAPGGGGGSLPPAARAKLKEGVITTFANKQQWTLKNGVPTRVK